MAEIKSTMDLVMERAARMGMATSEELQQEEAGKTGMKLTAAYLNDESAGPLADELSNQKPSDQMNVRRGMIEALLRNLFLPRDDIAVSRVERSVKGVIELGGGAGDLTSICREMQHIIGQYSQHREQLREQLEEQIRMQYEQLLAQQTGMQAKGLHIDPTMQPKFKEEWSRVEAELDSQYNQALNQHKNLLQQRLL